LGRADHVYYQVDPKETSFLYEARIVQHVLKKNQSGLMGLRLGEELA
jgi:hypothetical protein